MARDEFSTQTIDTLAKRVGCFCSNPDCGRATVGPHTDPTDWANIGVAAHITAAAPGGPRHDPKLTSDERKDISNGIWLCQSCSRMIDDDPAKYPTELLKKWKADKEAETAEVYRRGTRPSASGPFLDISPLLQLSSIPGAKLSDGSRVMLAYPLVPEEDPAMYVSALTFRLLVRPTQTTETTFILGVGIDVLSVESIPSHQPLAGAYPVRFSLYVLPFDDPKVAGTNRFLAERFFQIKGRERSEELPYQPIALEHNQPEIIDCRLAPRSPGFYTLRLFAQVSVGTTIKEQEFSGSLKVLVPEPTVFDNEVVTPNSPLERSQKSAPAPPSASPSQ